MLKSREHSGKVRKKGDFSGRGNRTEEAQEEILGHPAEAREDLFHQAETREGLLRPEETREDLTEEARREGIE